MIREESKIREVYKKNFKARWGDMDFNAHIANTAYLNVSGDVRRGTRRNTEEHGDSHFVPRFQWTKRNGGKLINSPSLVIWSALFQRIVTRAMRFAISKSKRTRRK